MKTLREIWETKGKFRYKGMLYKKDVNDASAEIVMNKKTVVCKVHELCEALGTNEDLDDKIHLGFTVGGGALMYWYLIWHGGGSGVTVYTPDNKKRWLNGTEEITIHWK